MPVVYEDCQATLGEKVRDREILTTFMGFGKGGNLHWGWPKLLLGKSAGYPCAGRVLGLPCEKLGDSGVPVGNFAGVGISGEKTLGNAKSGLATLVLSPDIMLSRGIT